MNNTPQNIYTPPPYEKKSRRPSRRTVGLWLIIAPTVLAMLSYAGYGVMNFLLANGTITPQFTPSTNLFETMGPGFTIINMILFGTSALATLSWLPAMIIGIVLLTTKPTPPSFPGQQ